MKSDMTRRPLSHSKGSTLLAANSQRGWSGQNPVALPSCQALEAEFSERKSRTDLYLPAGRGGLGDRAELRRVHEPVRRAQIHLVEAVESFQANLHPRRFGDRKSPADRRVKRLHART